MIAQLRAVHVGAVPAAGVLEVGAFLAITTLVSWPFMLTGSPGMVAIAMWIPGLVAILLARLAHERAIQRLGVDRLGWADAYFGALWLPVLFAIAGIAITVVAGAGRLDPDLGGILPASGASSDGAAVQTVITALTLAPLINMAVMVGGELGWRAYLVPLLQPLGSWRAIVITASLWTLWQLPLALLAAEDEIGLSVVVQLLWSLLIGAILGWLFIRTRSVWAPALFMGAIGSTSAFWPMFLRDAAPLLAGQVSLIGLVAPAVLLLVLPWIREND